MLISTPTALSHGDRIEVGETLRLELRLAHTGRRGVFEGRVVDVAPLGAGRRRATMQVTHELPSIFAIANNSVFLDPETKTMIAHGDPNKLLAECKDPTVHRFLTRGDN